MILKKSEARSQKLVDAGSAFIHTAAIEIYPERFWLLASLEEIWERY